MKRKKKEKKKPLHTSKQTPILKGRNRGIGEGIRSKSDQNQAWQVLFLQDLCPASGALSLALDDSGIFKR